MRWKLEHILCQLPLGLEHRLVPGCSDTLGCDFGLGVLGGIGSQPSSEFTLCSGVAEAHGSGSTHRSGVLGPASVTSALISFSLWRALRLLLWVPTGG